jgi:hypothetical protein
MNTLILSAETANMSIDHLLQQMSNGGVEVRDMQGNLVAFVLSPTDQEALTYVEASIYLDQHKEQVRQALERRGGITTSQLLVKAAASADKAP